MEVLTAIDILMTSDVYIDFDEIVPGTIRE